VNMYTRFETARKGKSRDLTIGKMLAELVLACQLIEADIAAEEARAGVFDRSDRKVSDLSEVAECSARQSQGNHCHPRKASHREVHAS
jgi:hypothetical protein